MLDYLILFEHVLTFIEKIIIIQSRYHHFENLTTPCISINFWFKCGKDDPTKVELPLRNPTRIISMRRNIEKITYKKLGNFLGTLFFSWLEKKLITEKNNSASGAASASGGSSASGAAGGGSGSGSASGGSSASGAGGSGSGGGGGGGGGGGSGGTTLPEQFAQQELSIRGMLKVVLDESTIDVFLYELVVGRFYSTLTPVMMEIVDKWWATALLKK